MVPMPDSVFRMDGEIVATAELDDGSGVMVRWNGTSWELTDRATFADVFSTDASQLTAEEAASLGLL